MKFWPAMRAEEMVRRRETMRRAIVAVGWLDDWCWVRC
jgi:hypothetical protein